MISIVLPTYNERENIGKLIGGIERTFKENSLKGEIIVVDDKSPDGTAEVARGLNKKYRNVRVVVRDKREGLGAAHATGYDSAKGDLIISMDSDLSHDLSDISKIADKLEEYDVVACSRYAGGRHTDKPLKNILISKWGARFISAVTGMKVHDFTNGYRGFRKMVWESIRPLKDKEHAFLAEFFIRAHKKGFSIYEMASQFKERTKGESKTHVFRESFKVFIFVLRNFIL